MPDSENDYLGGWQHLPEASLCDAGHEPYQGRLENQAPAKDFTVETE